MEELTRLADSLNKNVKKLDEDIVKLRIRAIILAWVALVVALAFSMILALTFIRQEVTNNRVSSNAARLDQIQRRTGNEVLCPLYTALLRSMSEQEGSPMSAEQRRSLEQFAVTIRRGMQVMQCAR